MRYPAIYAAIASVLCIVSSYEVYGQGRPPARPDWQLGVGGGSLISPVFEGSDDYALSLLPNLRLSYKDRFFASIPEGIGYAVIAQNGFKAGPLVKIRFGRDEDQGGSPFQITGNTDALLGLGDVGVAGEAGGFFDYTKGRWSTRLELRQGFGGHEGFIGELSVNYSGRANGFIYRFGPRVRYTSADYVNTYFGVTAEQSLASGLPEFQGGSGFNSFGFGGSFIKPLKGNWSLLGVAGYDRLVGDIADAPLVEERGSSNQATVGLFLNYQFGL
jgi:outer membrane scaffolding protein for murein synthesis (MipA/OmpV family)